MTNNFKTILNHLEIKKRKLNIIEQALLNAQEQENILGIIKKYLFNEDDEPTQEETDLLNTYFGYNNKEVEEDV